MSAEAPPVKWLEAARRAYEDLPPRETDDGTPTLGDLIVLGDLPPGATDLASGLEWALAEKDPAAAAERYLAVPADGLELLGSADLAIGRAGERRSLRCRFPLWLERGPASRWRRTGRLTPTELARARRHLQQLATGGKIGTALGHEIDATPDYREEIAEPLTRLLEILRSIGASPPAEAPPLAPPPFGHSNGGLRAWALAASILVAVLGFTVARKIGQLENLSQQQEHAARDHAREIANLEQESTRLEEEKAKALQNAAASAAAFDAVRQQLQRARKESVIANPELTILARPGSTRGSIKVDLDPDASHLLLLIPIGDLPRKGKYRLELLGAQEPWTSPDLEVLSPGELRLGIPASLLPEGKVALRLRAAKDSRSLAEYELVIRRKPAAH